MDKKQLERSTKAINKQLDGAIIDAQKALKKSIRKLEKKIISNAARLKTGRGKLRSFKTNFAQSRKLHKDIIKLFETRYNTDVRKRIKELDKILKIVIQEFVDIELSAKFTAIDKDMITVLKQNTYKQFEQFGVHAQQRVAQSMYDAIIAQSEFSELVDAFTGIMTGGVDARGRSMIAYADLYANDSIMAFHRSVHLMKANSAGLDHFMYVGSRMNTTRSFCRARIGNVYTREEIDSWNALDWGGKSGDVWVTLGGYNCRHSLRAIPTLLAKEFEKK